MIVHLLVCTVLTKQYCAEVAGLGVWELVGIAGGVCVFVLCLGIVLGWLLCRRKPAYVRCDGLVQVFLLLTNHVLSRPVDGPQFASAHSFAAYDMAPMVTAVESVRPRDVRFFLSS